MVVSTEEPCTQKSGWGDTLEAEYKMVQQALTSGEGRQLSRFGWKA